MNNDNRVSKAVLTSILSDIHFNYLDNTDPIVPVSLSRSAHEPVLFLIPELGEKKKKKKQVHAQCCSSLVQPSIFTKSVTQW